MSNEHCFDVIDDLRHPLMDAQATVIAHLIAWSIFLAASIFIPAERDTGAVTVYTFSINKLLCGESGLPAFYRHRFDIVTIFLMKPTVGLDFSW